MIILVVETRLADRTHNWQGPLSSYNRLLLSLDGIGETDAVFASPPPLLFTDLSFAISLWTGGKFW